MRGNEAPSRARRLVKTGDVLFATIRPTLQRIAIVPRALDQQVCSTGYFVFRPQREVDNRFLFYFLFTDGFMNRMEQLQKGASYPAVTDGEVRAQLIPVPPLPEQQRIVGVLDKALEGIAAAKAGAEKNPQNARALFESHLNDVFTKRGKGWVEKQMSDPSLFEIIDGDRGINYPKAHEFHDKDYCLFLNTKNVRSDGFDFETTMFVSKEKDEILRKGKLQREDVVMTTRGTLGNVGHYSKDVPFDNIRVNSGMLIFRPNRRVLLPAYLFNLLRSGIVKDQIGKYSTGAAQPQLPIKTLINFTIPVPQDLHVQQDIVNNIQTLEPETQRLSSLYQQKLAALEALKKSLLHDAFRGAL